jgi:hypothetical protein
MKLRDIIEALGKKKYWITFHYDWTVATDGRIVPVPEKEITLDSDVELHYQWYTHLNPKVNTKEIDAAIENHDYKTFSKWVKMFENAPWEYFPSMASIWSGDAYVGTVCVAYDEALFSLITSNDHECG